MVHTADDVLVMPTVVVTVPAAPVPPTTAIRSCDGWHSVVGAVVVVVVVVVDGGADVVVVVVDDWCVVEVDRVGRVDGRDAEGVPDEHPANNAARATAPRAIGHRRRPGGEPPGSLPLTRRSPPA